MKVAYADSLPQRFEGCFLEGSKICLFKDGTAIFKTEYGKNEFEYGYEYYRYVENWNKFSHTHQAILFKPALAEPEFAVYEGKNPNLTQGFQLTLFQFDKGYSQDEIIVDGQKLDFNTANSHPKHPDEIQFTFSHTPKQITLKKFIKDGVYPTTTYQLNPNHNTLLISSYRGVLSESDFPATYKNGQLALDFGKFEKHPFPFVSPTEAKETWDEFLKAKMLNQRIKDFNKTIYIDKNGWLAYQVNWIRKEEKENRLSNEQSEQFSQEIDEKLTNAGLIKLDLLTPTTVESSIK